MRITRRTVAGAITAGVLATGLAVMPASAMLVPPEPDVVEAEESQQSPAMTAGRAWCECHAVTYSMLWID